MPELLYALGILAGFIILSVILLLTLRGTLTIGYDGEFFLFFKILFFNIKLLPVKEKQKKYRKTMSRRKAQKIRHSIEKKKERKRKIINMIFGKKESAETQTEEKPQDTTQESAESGTVQLNFPVKLIAREIIDILSAYTEMIAIIMRRFTHHLRIRVARFKIKIATPDPSVTALTYGAATGILNVLLPVLRDVDNLGLPREESFDISTDFLSDTPEIDIKVSFSLRVWHIADVLIRPIFGGLSKYVDRKGGIDNTIESAVKLVSAFFPKKEKESKPQKPQKAEKPQKTEKEDKN